MASMSTSTKAQRETTPRPPANRSASSATSAGKGSAGRVNAKDLLRDYYGLSKAGSPSSGSKELRKTSSNADPLDIDSPTFSAQAYIQHLLSTSTLAQLLKASTELSTSISDLESERQSLVYNHHHELIDASVTISKMKVRAESLDTTLEQLKAGLSKCSELNDGLRLPVDGATEESSEQLRSTTTTNADWQTALGTILDLPFVMSNATPEEAQRLWGTYEPVLRQWKNAGVKGIEEVETECRQSLNGDS